MKNLLTSIEFKKVINQLMVANDVKDKISNLLRNTIEIETDFLSGHGLSIDHAGLVIYILDTMFDTDMISYFVYEGNYGHTLAPDSVTMNGKPIDITTVDKLYRFLIEELERSDNDEV